MFFDGLCTDSKNIPSLVANGGHRRYEEVIDESKKGGEIFVRRRERSAETWK